jgi:hypothetical protein
MALNRKHKPAASHDNPVQLEHVDSTRERISSAAVKLTDEERELLSDPDWIDEDEADRIMALRVERSQGNSAIPVEEYLKKRGRSLDR